MCVIFSEVFNRKNKWKNQMKKATLVARNSSPVPGFPILKPIIVIFNVDA